MNALEIVEQLKGKKGQHVKIEWLRMAKVLKDCPFMIAKRTIAWVRSGITYANLADIREGIEAGTREAVEGLPWGQWREGYTNYIIDHTPKGQTDSVEYIRLYPASFDNLATPTVQWTLDGQPVDYQAVESWLLSSEKRKDDEEKAACFTVKAESVVSIGD
jgi:hypothetical protein